MCLLNVPQLMDDGLVKLLGEAHPLFLAIKLLERRRKADWREAPLELAEIVAAQAVEAANIAKLCRRHVAATSTEIGVVREALWLDQLEAMKIVTRTQPELELNAKQFSEEPKKKRIRLPAKLSDDERVYRYIQEAGPKGVAAFEVKAKFAGKLTRQQVEDIGYMLQNMALIHCKIVRVSGRGRKGLRYFDVTHGTPNINLNGRLIPPWV